MDKYIININKDSDSVINVRQLQEYRQGITGNYRAQKNPNKQQDIEQCRIYIGYMDYFIGKADDDQNIITILSKSKSNDLMCVQKMTSTNSEPHFVYNKIGYNIVNRTRFNKDGSIQMSLGFDFENVKCEQIDDVIIFGGKPEGTQTHLVTDFISNNVISFNEKFKVRVDEGCKLENVYVSNSDVTLTSSCKNIKVNDDCSEIVFGKQCQQIVIKKNCHNIKFGDQCGIDGDIIISENCQNIKFGNNCSSNDQILIGHGSQNISIGNGCGVNGFIKIGSDCGTAGNIILGDQCGSESGSIIIGNECATKQGSLISIGDKPSLPFIGLEIQLPDKTQNTILVDQ